jgi:ATP-binding cassette subfamily F protein uup
MAPLLHLRDVALTFGGQPLLESAEIAVSAGERVCLVGRNGSGKSTLLKIAAGLIEPDSGERFVQPGATIRYLPQEPDFSGICDLAGLCRSRPRARRRSLTAPASSLEELGLTGEEDPRANLSGGEARRAALARVLAPEPDILLLDEPTNHLDLPPSSGWKASSNRTALALVLISHDRRFLSNLSRATVWLDRGQTRRVERGFSGFEEWRDEVLAEEERDRTSSTARSWPRNTGCATASPPAASAIVAASANLHALRDQRRDRASAVGPSNWQAERARIRQAGGRGHRHHEERMANGRSSRTLSIRIAARRPARHRRPERRRQDHADQHSHWRAQSPTHGQDRHGANIEMATLDQQPRKPRSDSRRCSASADRRPQRQVMVGGKPRTSSAT